MNRIMKKFNLISSANRALSLFWLVAISLSIIGIAFAATPNPGHNFTEVSGSVAQGDIMYGSATDVFSALAKNITATRYLSNTGASNNPAWAQVDLTNGVTGALPAANGGTGQSTYAVGDILYASAATVLSKLADIATGNALISGGVGVAPSWGKIGLTTHVSGILPTANGGTGIAFFTAAGPTVARVYTFPDAAATVLTSNAAVTVAQGGTGQSSYTIGDILYASGATALSKLADIATGNALI